MHMLKLEITNDTAESLFQDILIQDYRGMKKDIAALTARLDTLAEYEIEDLKNDQRWLNAMQIMMEYYLPHDQMKELIDEATVSK
jgi:hypothetical protein